MPEKPMRIFQGAADEVAKQYNEFAANGIFDEVVGSMVPVKIIDWQLSAFPGGVSIAVRYKLLE